MTSTTAASRVAVIGGADVERQLAAARNDVDRAVGDGELADRADKRGAPRASLLDIEHELGRRRRGVVAPRHRARCRHAPAVPVIVTMQRTVPAIALTIPTGSPSSQQDRSLLDVDLEIAQRAPRDGARARNAGGIQSRRGHRRRQGDAVGVAALQQARIETPRDRAAAEEARGEAHALFFGECDDVEVERQPAAEPLQVLGHDQRDEDAEPAVIFAGIADRIVVRRQDQRRRVWIVGGIASNDVGEPHRSRR